MKKHNPLSKYGKAKVRDFPKNIQCSRISCLFMAFCFVLQSSNELVVHGHYRRNPLELANPECALYHLQISKNYSMGMPWI